MGFRVLERSWQSYRAAGGYAVQAELEHGPRAIATIRDKPAFALVSLLDLKTLAALSEIRASVLARGLRSAQTQQERKALIRVLDWLAVNGTVDDDEAQDH